MKKYLVKYHYVMSDHILAVPAFHHKEVVEAASSADLRKYIEKQKDDWGFSFKKASPSSKRMFGFDYTSKSGGVKVSAYKPPRIKKV